ncbi:MAG: precorrin-6Y C5,15-methyltransferase (decarboxylating) subunit CbiT [Firmicutes bacterium HGW-Firmicutes-7]|nr:MAG: precorrin-6Y C5,15-methyltransferase (decarboxylating) subunit CbiT [Firmicutes bacterium HGW-Firmicutes-7]
MSWNRETQGIPDEEFVRGSIPMTKCEIRTISLSKLQLKKTSKVLDIGCGTGSMSIECGILSADGFVTAIDQNDEAVELTLQNARKFNVKNISIIRGKAPERLPEQTYDRIFLGGGSKAIEPIIAFVKEHLTPSGIFVANTILLESTYKILQALENEGFIEISCTQAQISRGLKNPGWMMKALNPVYIISAINPIREEKSNG